MKVTPEVIVVKVNLHGWSWPQKNWQDQDEVPDREAGGRLKERPL